jgi:hypothetical protein
MGNIVREKKKVIALVALTVFLVFFIWFVYGGKNSQMKQGQDLITPTADSLPLVDASVNVELVPFNSNKEIKLSVANIPKGTKEIEYVVTYETKDGALQGVNSTVKIEGASFERKITLGTCSSGTCVYHQVKDKIKLELLFRGNYGERYFSKDYDLSI